MRYLSTLSLALVMVLTAVACATTPDTTWPSSTEEPTERFTVSNGQVVVIWPTSPPRPTLGAFGRKWIKDPNSGPSTPAGPKYSEQEAIAVLKAHLMKKSAPEMYAEQGTSCWETLDDNPNSWSGEYDLGGARWDIRGRANDQIREKASRDNKPMGWFTWSVHERTESVFSTGGDEPLNRAC